MSFSRLPGDHFEAGNRSSHPASNLSDSARPSGSPAPLTYTSPSPALSSQNGPSIPMFSSTTEEILRRIKDGSAGYPAAGSAAFEAKRAEIMQNYMTSDRLPTPPPVPNTGRRGKTRNGTPLKTEFSASPAVSARGSGRGRPRGRGRGGGRGGKRKRAETSEEESDNDNDSDVSESYTPVTTRTKSGRNVNKPVAFVPTIPEPTREGRRRRSTKTVLAAQCNVCHRGTETGQNRIVFCDMCNTAYHQYCHDPPVDNEVVNVLEKEWLCQPCTRAKQSVVQGTEDLVPAGALSIDDRRAYLSTLPHTRLVSLLLHATVRHPELPIFPENVEDLIPEKSGQPIQPTSSVPPQPQSSTSRPSQPPPTHIPTTHSHSHSPNLNGALANGTPPSSTPRSTHANLTDGSDVDPAEAQLLGEISRSHYNTSPSQQRYGIDTHFNPDNIDDNDEEGYDTDPPAHYPRPGRGLARTLRPQNEDLEWMIDDNTEVFSHGWKGDGSGVGADAGAGAVNGNGNGSAAVKGEGDGESMEGVVQGAAR